MAKDSRRKNRKRGRPGDYVRRLVGRPEPFLDYLSKLFERWWVAAAIPLALLAAALIAAGW